MRRNYGAAVALAVLGVICLIEAEAMAQRTRIGIVPFKNKAGVAANVGDVLVDMLTTAMTRSRKFEVVERTALNDVVDEQLLGKSGMVDKNYAASLGKIKGVQYLLVGVVTEAGAAKGLVDVYGVQMLKQSGVISLDVRWIDTSTGSVVFAETFRRQKAVVDEAFDVNMTSGPMAELAREVVEMVARRTLASVYPPKVVKCDGSEVILNYGDSMFQPGERWTLFRQGEELKDPDTGESLGFSRTAIGEIEITITTDKITNAKLLSGQAEVGATCGMAKEPQR